MWKKIVSIVFVYLVLQLALGSFLFMPGIVFGDSMEPVLSNPDVVVYTYPVDGIEEGDIVLISEPDSEVYFLTHKVVAIDERDGKTLYLTKGVNNEVPDVWYTRDDIYAEVHPIF